jgi:hypothetical protein
MDLLKSLLKHCAQNNPILDEVREDEKERNSPSLCTHPCRVRFRIVLYIAGYLSGVSRAFHARLPKPRFAVPARLEEFQEAGGRYSAISVHYSHESCLRSNNVA